MSNAIAAYRAYEQLEREYEGRFDLTDLSTVGTLREMSALERAGQLIAERGHTNAMMQFVLKAAEGSSLTDFDMQIVLAIDEDARQ